MLQYRLNRLNQPRNLSNSIDGITHGSYQPRATQVFDRQNLDKASDDKLDIKTQSVSPATENSIVSDASVFAKNLVDSKNIPDTKPYSEKSENLDTNTVSNVNATPFGLVEQTGINHYEVKLDQKVDPISQKTKRKLSFKPFKFVYRHRGLARSLFKPPWAKLKNWEEFKIFTAGATLAAGLIVLGFYLGFNRPLSIAESLPSQDFANTSEEVLAEHVVQEKPVVKETEDGHKVEVSQGINPNEVDRRPPTPVEPNLPVRMRIPSIKVNAPIRSVGLLPDKTLAVPNYVYQVGWYDKSARPGEPGTILMDGHYGVSGAWGVFSRLKEVGKGAEIELSRGDGQTVTYIVEENTSYEKDKTPMDKAFAKDDKQRLSIVTCDGTYLPTLKTYSHRRIVYAVKK